MLDKKVKKICSEQQLLARNSRILLGVSGGADSVCLLQILHRLTKEGEGSLVVLHINHGIRGAEAYRDECFVVQLCRTLQVPCFVEHLDIPALARERGMGEEEAGRQERYRLFEKYCAREDCDRIAVAHHGDDQVETILHHLIRGSGLDGLAGMTMRRGTLIRPLLYVTRKEILEYLEQIGQDYVEDSTNFCRDYTRNRIRQELIPYLEQQMNPQASAHILELSRQMRQLSDYMDRQAEISYAEVLVSLDVGKSLRLSCRKLEQLDSGLQPFVIRKALREGFQSGKDVTAEHIRGILELLERQASTRQSLPGGLCARREYETLCLECDQVSLRGELSSYELPSIQEAGEEVLVPGLGLVQIQLLSDRKNFSIEENRCTKFLDYDRIKGKLAFRTRRPGDYLVLNNRGDRQKIKKYFINQKIPEEERDQIWLLADGAHILWVLGGRISAWYGITPQTRRALCITVTGLRDL